MLAGFGQGGQVAHGKWPALQGVTAVTNSEKPGTPQRATLPAAREQAHISELGGPQLLKDDSGSSMG